MASPPTSEDPPGRAAGAAERPGVPVGRVGPRGVADLRLAPPGVAAGSVRRRGGARGRPGRRAPREAVRRRLGELFGAGGPAFRTLAHAHAASTAGDTLIAVALANSLFFQVPSGEARGNVALYLLLTVAPFAVIGPLLGRLLDREGAERTALLASSALRVAAAALLIPLAGSFWLFPLAFTLLVLSRAHGIARSALLPQALTTPIALVTANARLAQIGVLGGALAAPVGAGLAVLGEWAVLAAAALAFALAAWRSLDLPRLARPGAAEAGEDPEDVDPPAWAAMAPLPLLTPAPRTAPAAAVEQAWEAAPSRRAEVRAAADRPAGPVDGVEAPPDGVEGVRPVEGVEVQGPPSATSGQLRVAGIATGVVRLLNGYLVLVLAFAFRDVDAPVADFGALLAAAGVGYGLAAVAAPVLERALREEPMVVAALAVEAAAAFVAGQFFSLPAAALLSLAAGYAWGTAKFAFDGLLQATVAPAARGRAFTRSETAFQLAWVLGAVLPTGLPIDVRIGLAVAGCTALAAQTLYVSRLLARTAASA
jgi:hypothetical protein